MANADKVVDYVSAVLSNFIPKPADIVLKPLFKPVGDHLKAWLKDKETQKALLKAAEAAESDFRKQATEKFRDDKLSQAVASFPLHNGELFQVALQNLPSHFNETFLANHINNDLSKYWSGEFSVSQIQEATALYIDCLRVRLLRVNGFADIVTRLAVLRTDRRTEDIHEIVTEIQEKLSDLTSTPNKKIVFRSLHQLPQPPADFTGREELIEQLVSDYNSHKGATISGLTGMGGIGKTVLGLKVAHKIVEDYPDAQVFLDLRGTTQPLSAVDIARQVILSFEPNADLHALDETNFQSVYQSTLHGKKTLLFFDNARSADQIAPLIPPETCAMLVTSRWTFSVPGLHGHRVDVMKKEEARRFLLELCPRLGDKASKLAKVCAYLPLALRIAGSYLQVNSDWSIDKYLDQLNNHKERLEILQQSRKDAELTYEPDLFATFEISYNQLLPKYQKYWHILGLFPASFAVPSAQAMWKLDEDETIKTLGLFMRYNLVEYDKTSARYYLHDLLTVFALSRMQGSEEWDARLTYASHFMDVMKLADEFYSQGGDKMLQGLAIFDSEWAHISTAHSWSAHESSKSQAAAEICNYTGTPYCLEQRLPPGRKIEWLEAALNASRALKDRGGESAHLGNLGAAYGEVGDLNKATELFEKQLKIARQQRDREGEVATIANLGNVNLTLGNTLKAVEYFEKALKFMRERNDLRGEATCLCNLGIAYSDLGDENKAIEFYTQALKIDREIGDRSGESMTLLNLGAAYQELGNANEAIKFIEQALDIAHEIGNKRGDSTIFNNLGLAYMEMDDVNKAIEFFEQQLDIARKFEDRKNEGSAFNNLGSAYHTSGNVGKAIEYQKQALVIACEVGDRRGESAVLGNLGLSYGALGDVHKASEFFQQALVISREIGDRRSEGILLGRLGSAYDELGNTQAAIESYENALAADLEVGNRSSVADVLGNLGIVYAESGDIEKAMDSFEQSIKLSRELGDRRGESDALGNLGTAYLSLENSSMAINLLNEAISIAESVDDQVNLGKWLCNLGIAFYDLNEKKKAISLMKKALATFEKTESEHTEWAREMLQEWGAK